ncbi:PAAR domain-containing protein [Cupriavidus oxalaticus]|uniref:PAAR domain-containing protein n=1 Tax=Cupriavidus oxalaticus TaxID=96344 RepID=UPI003180D979
MSDMRYALRNGDKTSVGGKLIATGQSLFHHDRTIGIEGDHATCPTCKTGGPVMNDCHPDFDIGGKQILVSGARVYCKCSIHPTVIHSQTSFTVQVNRGGRRIAPTEEIHTRSGYTGLSADLEQFFELVDVNTNTPIEGYRYDLYSSGELIAKNKVMTDGRTHSVSGTHDVRAVIWLGE